MDVHSTITFPNLDGSSKDLTKLQVAWSVTSAYTVADSASWWDTWLNNAHVGATNATGAYLSNCVSRGAAAGQIKDYDITAHLDGSPAGSPIGVDTLTLVANVSGHSHGNQIAMVLSLGANSESQPVDGVMGVVPTPESAVDMGAPATHMGQLKVRARYQNRVFLGPIGVSAGGIVDQDGNNNPIWDAGILTDVSDNASFIITGAPIHGRTWSAWSRRDAALRPITGGWIDHGLKTRRKREYLPNSRTTFDSP